MSVAIPDYIPQLRSGASPSPQLGGCLVQIANWLADPAVWTDGSIFVDNTLARWGITINDRVDDAARRRLALAAARISGTQGLLKAEQRPLLEAWIEDNDRRPIHERCTCPCNAVLRGWPDHQVMVDWYFNLIDEFDRLTGRNADVEQPADRYRELAELAAPPVAELTYSKGGIVSGTTSFTFNSTVTHFAANWTVGYAENVYSHTHFTVPLSGNTTYVPSELKAEPFEMKYSIA